MTVGDGIGVGGEIRLYQIIGRKAPEGKPAPICTDPSRVVPGTLCPAVPPNDAGGLFAENPALAAKGVGGFLLLRMMLSITPSGKDAKGTSGSMMKKSISPSGSVMSGFHWPEKSLGRLKAMALGIVSSNINQVSS